MPERKIGNPDWYKQQGKDIRVLDICRDPNHEPACMLYRTPGTYEHTCPACGETVIFEVPRLMLA